MKQADAIRAIIELKSRVYAIETSLREDSPDPYLRDDDWYRTKESLGQWKDPAKTPRARSLLRRQSSDL